MFKNALISVSDKSGLLEFLKPLVAQGLRVVSTGGTAKHLRENGIPVVEVAAQTGFPEVMDGRVRTLHPYIHMPLLARAGEPEDMQLLKEHKLEPFDLIIVNLYPFAEAMKAGKKGDELIEFIDIGGPSLLRAAAKNHERVSVVCDPVDYPWIAEKAKKGLSLNDRRRLAAKVFAHTTRYDALIANELSKMVSDVEADKAQDAAESFKTTTSNELFQYEFLAGDLVQELRYGENPQQKASWFRANRVVGGLHDAEILHGKALSYNNLLDLDAATRAIREFQEPCSVAVKHNNPCGVGLGPSAVESTRRAISADPVSVFGGIIALNRTVDFATAEVLAQLFLECVVAPDFSDTALERLRRKKDLRLLRWPQMMVARDAVEFRTVEGGYLLQAQDRVAETIADWKLVGEPSARAIPAEVQESLTLAWKVCASLKSNAIAIASQGQTIGLGMGQVNRVDAVEQAIRRMQQHHAMAVAPVLASDAFFPFPDSIEKIHAAGIRWVIQPGGSIRDEEVFARARDLKVNLVITGVRHFRH